MADKEVALRLPMSIDTNGSLSFTTNQEQIWADRVRIALGTRLGERAMRTSYGSKIGNSVFSTVSGMEEIVRREVNKIFNEQFPLLSLSDAQFNFDEVSNRLTVNLSYSLPNNQSSNIVVGIITVSDSVPLYEEIS